MINSAWCAVPAGSPCPGPVFLIAVSVQIALRQRILQMTLLIMEDHMKHSWRLRRTLIPQPDAQLRWDQAYQALLRWSIPPSLPPPQVAQIPQIPELPQIAQIAQIAQVVPSTQQVITLKPPPLIASTPSVLPIPPLPLSISHLQQLQQEVTHATSNLCQSLDQQSGSATEH